MLATPSAGPAASHSHEQPLTNAARLVLLNSLVDSGKIQIVGEQGEPSVQLFGENGGPFTLELSDQEVNRSETYIACDGAVGLCEHIIIEIDDDPGSQDALGPLHDDIEGCKPTVTQSKLGDPSKVDFYLRLLKEKG